MVLYEKTSKKNLPKPPRNTPYAINNPEIILIANCKASEQLLFSVAEN